MNKHLIIGAAVAGLVLAFAVKKTAATAVAAVGDAVNPMNNDNVFNKGFTSIYQTVFDTSGTLGTNLYEATHGGALDPTSGSNVIARGVDGAWRAVGVLDEHETLGTKVYDTVDSVENWIKGIFK